MIISLLGFMGSGKSTLGKRVAKALSYQFIDLDQYIENKEGMSVNDIFEKHSETYFREKESLYLKEIFKDNKDNIVLSLGGGTPCFHDNMKIINEHSKSIHLNYNAKLLLNRLLPGIDKRPLLKDKSEDEIKSFITNKLKERSVYYNKAQYQITRIDDPLNQILNLI